MAFSINDFRSATAYPCGNKKECQSLLKKVRELENVKMISQTKMRSTLHRGSASFESHTSVHE